MKHQDLISKMTLEEKQASAPAKILASEGA